jgi:hypothetical protein
MKFFLIFILCIFFGFFAPAQRIKTADYKLLQKKEDSLKLLSQKIVEGINPSDRLKADSIFTRVFVRTLKTANSFYFPFDSLYAISKLYAPDSSFRIYTWQMVINENVIRQHGAIQMKTADGSLKLFPLIDKSDITENMADTIANNYGWMGAVYYKIILTTYEGRSFYTLLGYDENNIRSNKKMIELLNFKNGEPLFGSRQFSIAGGYGYNSKMARFIMEYKKQASPRLTYDEELNVIVVEHLISESNQPGKKWTLVGDGDYQAFRWQDGRWVYIDKLFNEVTPLGQEPVPSPLRDTDGKIDETKLKINETEPAKKPAAPPRKKDN